MLGEERNAAHTIRKELQKQIGMYREQVGMLHVQVGLQQDLLSKQGAALEMAARAAAICVKRMMPGDDASWDARLADLPALPEAALLLPLSVPTLSSPPLPSPSKPNLAISPLTPSPRSATLRSGSFAHRRRARRRLFDSALRPIPLPNSRCHPRQTLGRQRHGRRHRPSGDLCRRSRHHRCMAACRKCRRRNCHAMPCMFGRCSQFHLAAFILMG